jgi:membrane-associated phospholipid phosphatase
MTAAWMPTKRLLAWTALAGAGLYAVFTLAVASGALDGMDLAVNRWVVHNVGDHFLGIHWAVWTSIGGGIASAMAVSAAAFLAWRAGALRTAVVIVAASVLGAAMVTGFKDLHERPYPGGREVWVVPAGNGTACPEDSRCDYRLGENATVYCPPGSRCNFYAGNGTFNATRVGIDLDTFPDRPGRAYPSGHTMGATLSWGLALLLGTRAVQRTKAIDKWALGAWVGVALVGGLTRLPVHAHWITDVVASWFLGVGLLAAAVLVDEWWNAQTGPKPRLPR